MQVFDVSSSCKPGLVPTPWCVQLVVWRGFTVSPTLTAGCCVLGCPATDWRASASHVTPLLLTFESTPPADLSRRGRIVPDALWGIVTDIILVLTAHVHGTWSDRPSLSVFTSTPQSVSLCCWWVRGEMYRRATGGPREGSEANSRNPGCRLTCGRAKWRRSAVEVCGALFQTWRNNVPSCHGGVRG